MRYMNTSEIMPEVIRKVHMKKGYACTALYNNVWHRGEIQGIPTDGSVKIFFVDYGTVDQIPITDVRYLLNSFCSAPMCYRGKLDFVKPINYRWDVETTEFFLNLVSDKKCVAGVSEIDYKVYHCHIH